MFTHQACFYLSCSSLRIYPRNNPSLNVVVIIHAEFCGCLAGVETATSSWARPQTTLFPSGTSWLETVTRGSASPPPSWSCSATPETCESFISIKYNKKSRSDYLQELTVSPVPGTRSWCVPWSRPQSCWLCQTANTLFCLWMTTQTWMWWQLLTGGGSTSTPATLKERSVSQSGRDLGLKFLQ